MKKNVFNSFKKKVGKICSLALVTMIFVYSAGMNVYAAEFTTEGSDEVIELETVICDNIDSVGQSQNAKAMLYNCRISVICSSDGLLAQMSTDCMPEASAIGVKDISIEKRVWYGWKEVAVSSGGEISDSTTFGGSLLYTDAEYGETYRITCTHYATADEYVEVVNQTDGFVFTY